MKNRNKRDEEEKRNKKLERERGVGFHFV